MALALDAALWGRLRNHIDLESLIFAKLPLDAFFRLRLVCKEWNRLASDRAFLLEHFSSLQPPYFVVDTHTGDRLLRRDGGWTWARLPPVKCDSSGLLMEDSDDLNRVFDLHTRIVHTLPDVVWERDLPWPVEEDEENGYYEEPSEVGMIVDATVKPYAFRVVFGNGVQGWSKIYNSRSRLWTKEESTFGDDFFGPRRGRIASAFCDGILDIRVPSFPSFELMQYNVQRDRWSREYLPGIDDEEWVCCDFGVWEDCLYLVGMNFFRPRRILVWELLKQPLPEGYYFSEDFGEAFDDNDYDGIWKVFDVMPDDLWLWLLAGKEEKLQGCWDEYFDIRSRFCGEYVLVYNSVGSGEYKFTEERAVLYNLKLRKWEKVDLPGSVV